LMHWARLLKRVFELDLEHCPICAGELKVIVAQRSLRRLSQRLDLAGTPRTALPDCSNLTGSTSSRRPQPNSCLR